VTADDRIDAVEHTRLDQLGRAARRNLLGVLEEKTDLASELRTHYNEQARRREQHRRVPVVPACVHDSSGTRGELDSAFLLERERIDVGAKRERRPRPPTA
jgi:hypothetical protein